MVLLLKDLRIIFLYFNHPANVGKKYSGNPYPSGYNQENHSIL
jgi:hypothetical protein